MAMGDNFISPSACRESESERGAPTLPQPVLYHDSTCLTAVYTASTSEIVKLLPDKIHPVELFPRRALVAFSCFIHRRTDIGPYHEFAIAFPVTEKKKAKSIVGLINLILKKQFNLYVWQLAASSEVNRGGITLLGYPKCSAQINFVSDFERIAFTVSVGEKNILTLTGKRLGTKPWRPMEIVTYSEREQNLIKTRFQLDSLAGAGSLKGDTATLNLGDHSIARKLRTLNLGYTPVYYLFLEQMESILFEPEEVSRR